MPHADEAPLLSREVPSGVPRLASWWWRALLGGGTIGMIPLVAVLWHFGDVPIGALADAAWPGLTRWIGSLLSPLGWVLVVALLGAWCASTRRQREAADAWNAIACMATGWALCGALDLLGLMARLTVPAERAARWSHCAPSAACAVSVALATWAWGHRSSLRWPLTVAAFMVMAADVADGVAFASDAVAGAWIGFAAALLVPWVRWRRAVETAAKGA